MHSQFINYYIFIFMNRRKYHFNHLDLNLKYEFLIFKIDKLYTIPNCILRFSMKHRLKSINILFTS